MGSCRVLDHAAPARHTLIVTTVLSNVVGNCRSADEAGPSTTAPLVLNSDPWQGHTYREFAKPVTAQPSCVQTAVTVVHALCAVRATRYVPVETVTVAAPPMAASGDPALTAIVSVRLTSVPDTEGKAGAELGEVVLPPQAGTTTPSVNRETA
jgi:hypothetical protein